MINQSLLQSNYPSSRVTEEILRRGEAEILRLTNNAANNTAAGNNNNNNNVSNAAAANTAAAPAVEEVVFNNNNNNNTPSSARVNTFPDRSRGARVGAVNPVDAAAMAASLDTSHLGVDMNNPSVNNPNDAAMMRFLGHINPDTQRERRAEHRNAVQAAAARGEQRAQDVGDNVLELPRFARHLIPPLATGAGGGDDFFSSLLDPTPHAAAAPNTTTADANNNDTEGRANAANAREGDVPGIDNNNGSERRVRRRM